MDRRRLSACANFGGYTDAMGHHINPTNVSITSHIKKNLQDVIENNTAND